MLLHILTFRTNIARVIKSIRTRWTEHVAENALEILVEKREARIAHVRQGKNGSLKLKWILKN
jgi:hypothetical protein